MEETAQELTDHVSQFQKYLDEHTPELISFGIKVVLSIVVLYLYFPQQHQRHPALYAGHRIWRR